MNVEQWQPVSLHDIFCAGDRIRVGDESRADIALANRAVLRLDQNTTITLGGIRKEQTVLVVFIESATDVFTRAIRAVEVGAPFVKQVWGGNGRIDSDRRHSTGNHHPWWEGCGRQGRGNVFSQRAGIGRFSQRTRADVTTGRHIR